VKNRGYLFSFVVLFAILLFGITNCSNSIKNKNQIIDNNDSIPNDSLILINYLDSLFQSDSTFISNGFDYPVGPPNGKGYYDAQPFGKNNHLGEDWNGSGGGNSDLGDLVYTIGNGYVRSVKDFGGGWGNVVRIIHCIKDTTGFKYIESLYAHLDIVKVEDSCFLKKGQAIGTIGNCNGLYYAHLHFEIRDNIFMDLGGGYNPEKTGFLEPKKFISRNRNLD
jgi:murein DD-endopeptidase MepM/ murein hydrolase activator NlpD